MAKSAPKAAKDEVEFFDVEQRSDEWLMLRRGIPTASNFAKVIADGKDGGDSKMRQDYMDRLAGELISGQVAESFKGEAMERGNRVEPGAREWYARTRLADLAAIGFVRRTIVTALGFSHAIGCSPDSKVSARKGVEFKSVAPHLLVGMKRRRTMGFPPVHRAQLHGTMLCCDWDEMDLVLFYPGWPNPPVFKVERDDAYIDGTLRPELEKFCYELGRLVELARR